MRAMALLAGILAFAASAFGQAMAEGALTHALSTATGTAVGKAMGNTANQMSTRVAGRLGQQTSSAVPRSRIQTVRPGVQNSSAVPPSGTTAEPPPGGSLIASIQGAAPQPACASTAKDSQSETNSASKPAACLPAADSHPSMITLPAPK